MNRECNTNSSFCTNVNKVIANVQIAERIGDRVGINVITTLEYYEKLTIRVKKGETKTLTSE